jgi:hypothetical protein
MTYEFIAQTLWMLFRWHRKWQARMACTEKYLPYKEAAIGVSFHLFESPLGEDLDGLASTGGRTLR